jgi:hypothetical protein
MRFVLDSHPDMARGPETNVAHTFAKLVLNEATAREEAALRQVAGHPSVRRAGDAHTPRVPRGRFICLFWHCMDVIASGVEATGRLVDDEWNVTSAPADPRVRP